MKKFKLFKLLALFVVLITSINTAMADDRGWFSSGMWQVWGWKTGYGGDGWLATSLGSGSDYNIGVTTEDYTFKGLDANTWGGDNVDGVKCYFKYPDGTTSNTSLDWQSTSGGNKYWKKTNIWDYSIDQSKPGNFTIDIYFKIVDGGKEYNENHRKITWTIPGFTTTSTSNTFANTTVSSTTDEFISFGNHYGTALQTSNCALSGTNRTEFEVRSINETGVTVRFKPSSDGTKSATLTITDAHSRTCTITLSGTTRREVSYQHGDNATGSTITDYKVYGSNLTLRSSGFTRTGYNLTAWNTNSNGSSGTNYDLGATYSSDATLTLYPTWEAKTTTVTLNVNGATSGSNQTVTATYDAAMPDEDNSSNAINQPSKTGYTFGGYYDTSASSGGTQYYTSANPPASARTWNKDASTSTLWARWTANTYTLTLKQHNGDSDGSATATYDATISVTPPTKTGYTFNGYYTADEGGTQIIDADGHFVASVTNYTNSSRQWIRTSAETLHAQWTVNTYTIEFDPNDDNYLGTATGSTASMAGVEYDEEVTLTKNGFKRTGYTFAGWNTQADGEGVDYDDEDDVSNLTDVDGKTVTLYAKWIGETCTVSFYEGLGTVTPTSSTVTMGATYGEGTGLVGGELPTPTPMDGYVFVGWFTAYEGGTEVTSSTQVTTYLDHTIYARYTQKMRVYFKNMLGWSNVYVTYDAYWNEDGNGNSNDLGSGNKGKIYHLMTQQGTSDIWYDDIPDACLVDWKYNICFNSQQLGDVGESSNYNNFHDGQAVFRRDFDRNTRMFVPTPNDPNKFIKNNPYGFEGTTYYSTDQASGNPAGRYKNGYWVSCDYNTKANYTLKGTWDSWAKDNHIVSTTLFPDSIYVYTIRGLSASTTYQFKLWKLCASNTTGSIFSSKTAITSATAADAAIFNAADGGTNASMTTTVAGDYVFMFNFSKDGKVKLTIEYPYKTNDYRVLYSWDDGSAKERASESIHPKAGSAKTISMFVHKSGDVTSNSLKIQKYNGSTWNDVTGGGINISGVTESGVYNFVITQPASGDPTGELLEKYEGNYYIRLDSAAGGWDQYKVYGSSKMTLSEYSMTQTLSDPYSHYYCQYVDDYGSDISYAIATDFSPNISGTMVGDDVIGVGNKTLPTYNPANVRFSWNERTNAMRRAYLKSAQGAGNKRFLVLHGSDAKVLDEDGNPITGEGEGPDQLHANELLFSDNGNWVYEVDLKAQPGAKISLIAKYNGSDRYLIGGASSWETILGGKGSNKYKIRAVYDFKTNRLLTAWTPDNAINDTLSDVDLMLIRERDDAGTAITFGAKGVLDAKKVIGAIQFNYDDMVGSVTSWTPASRLLLKYFISFPFDVNVSDVFGLNSRYGDAYVIMKYNGAKRAEKGFFLGDGTTTFWEDLTLDSVMHANEGYCVVLDNDRFNYSFEPIWKNKSAGSSVYLYFPSASNVGNIASVSKTITVPSHECKINRKFYHSESSQWLNHTYTDSHWNMMGVPIFNDHTGDASAEGTPGAIFTRTEIDTTKTIAYFYEWTSTDNQFHIRAANGFKFKVMHSYMVQYTGDVTFTGSAPVPAGIAARRLSEDKNYQIELQVLNNNEDVLNRTYVELRENACDTFALNEDVYMAPDALAASIFTFAGSYDVAANVLSINNHIVPMGVCIRQAGTYTFSMPSNFSGTVTLIDTYTQTRTNLAFGDYSVNMPKGTNVDRFLLEIDINQAPTAIDGVEDGSGSLKDGKAHKFIENGVMYILKNGEIFDAQGNRVR